MRISGFSGSSLETGLSAAEMCVSASIQFATHSVEELLKSVALVDKGSFDAVDINLGCPQRIAARGYYGSYLLNNWPLAFQLVRAVHLATPFPVTAKIRLLDTTQETVSFAQMLVAAGARVICVHGRMPSERQSSGTPVDLEAIATIRRAVDVPVIANGLIDSLEAHRRCIAVTGCAGTMAGMGLLRFPAMYRESRALDGPSDAAAFDAHVSQCVVFAREYLGLLGATRVEKRTRRTLATSHVMKMFNFLFSTKLPHLRNRIVEALRVDDANGFMRALESTEQEAHALLPDAKATLAKAVRVRRLSQGAPVAKRAPGAE